MFEDGQALDADDGAGGLLLGDAQACRLPGGFGMPASPRVSRR
jgi:hypothetical protein